MKKGVVCHQFLKTIACRKNEPVGIGVGGEKVDEDLFKE
jgi:hypothetical protein